MQDIDSIIATCKKELNRNPEDMEALDELGHVYMHSGQYEKAIESFQRIVNISPDKTEAWFLLYAAHREKGQDTEGAKILQSIVDNLMDAVSEDPEDLESWSDLGFAYLEKGQKDKVKEVYEHLKSIDVHYADNFKQRLSDL